MSVLLENLILCVKWLPFILILAVIKYYFDKRRLFALGNRLPGPRPWPIIGNALHFATRDLVILDKITELNRKYGLAAFWIGHRLHVYISDPEDAEVLFTSRHLHNNSEDYKFLEPALGKGLLTANGADWKKGKKMIEPGFRYLSTEGVIKVFQEKSNVLIQCLQKEEGKKAFSVFPYMKKCAFDIVCGAATPICLNTQTQETEIIEHIDAVASYMWERMFKIWQHFDFIYKRTEAGKDFYRRMEYLRNFVDPMIKAVRASVINNQDVEEESLSKETIAERILKENFELDDLELRDHVFTMIAAGYETTATAISFILIVLGIHQDVQEKLYKELSNAFKGGLEEKELHQVEYLNMVIKETLRLFPPGPHLLRRADQDVQIGKHLIPKGATVGVNIFAIHRNPRVYENPEVFNPDNFLPGNIKKRHPYSFIPFGNGARKCIGANLAMLGLRSAVSKIVCTFRIECDLKMEDIKLKDEITLRTKDGLYPIRVIKR